MSAFRSKLAAFRSWLRIHSQMTVMVIGVLISVGGATAWYYEKIGPIRGSLIVGIGASVIAAAIVAYLSPFSESAYRRFISLGIDQVWPSRQDVEDLQWVDWVGQARNTCTLLGIAHGNWCKDVRFPGTLTDRLNRGVIIKIFFLNPDSSAAELRTREETKKRDTRKVIRESIEFLWKLRASLDAGSRDRLRIFVYDATPSCGLTWVDDIMIVTHYLAGLPNVTSPALLVKQPAIGLGRTLYNTYAGNMQSIEKDSTEVDDRNIEQFLPLTPRKDVAPDRVQPDGPEGETKGA